MIANMIEAKTVLIGRVSPGTSVGSIVISMNIPKIRQLELS